MAAGNLVTRRLFFAIALDESCRGAVERLIDQLAQRLSLPPGSTKGRIRWIERDNLHLTVRFLGATPETRLAELRAAVEAPFASRGFEVRFDRLGAFPDYGLPRLVWLGASAGAAEAETVQRELEQRLHGIGVTPEGRPFRAHLTLGRFRKPGGATDRRVIRDFTMEPLDPLRVEHITLYESHLSNRGPTYEPLLQVPLSRRS